MTGPKNCRYIVLSEKKWHLNLFIQLRKKFASDSWLLIDNKDEFVLTLLESFQPTKIFIPHWSYLIPREILEKFECIVFHMTDLPFGRGGSPLQNLIARGYKRTKISAIRVADGIDTGDVYLKKNLELDGSASEIFVRAAAIIEDMISEIIINEPTPKPQFGEIIEFKRRQPRESDMKDLSDLEMIYDQIRMLDCEGYPHAFLETTYYKVEFTNASFNQLEKLITANVRIFKK